MSDSLSDGQSCKVCSSCGNPRGLAHFTSHTGRETSTCSMCRRRFRLMRAVPADDATYQLVAILGMMRSRLPASRNIAGRHVAQQLGILPATVAAIWRGDR